MPDELECMKTSTASQQYMPAHTELGPMLCEDRVTE